MNPAPVEPTARLNDLIEALHSAADKANYPQLIEHAAIDVEDLANYRFLPEVGYGRNLIYSCDQFEVILMCWPDQQRSAVHDHADSLCIMKCIEGELIEQRYQRGEEPSLLQQVTEHRLRSGDLQQIDDSQGLHSINNRSGALACSLHFYFPAIHSCHLYCSKTGEKQQVFSLFTSEFGVRC